MSRNRNIVVKTLLSSASLFMATAASISPSHAAQRLSLDEVCKRVQCRSTTEFTAHVDTKRYLQGEWPRSPYFFEGVGGIVLGETLSFEAIEKPDGKLDLIFVPEPTETSITIELDQPSVRKGNVMTVATIRNRSDYSIIYEGGLYHIETKTFSQTSVCAILTGLTAYESWPYALGMFIFRHPRAVSEQEALEHGCR